MVIITVDPKRGFARVSLSLANDYLARVEVTGSQHSSLFPDRINYGPGACNVLILQAQRPCAVKQMQRKISLQNGILLLRQVNFQNSVAIKILF